MKTITLSGFVHCKPQSCENKHVIDGLEYSFWRFDDLSNSGYAVVGPATVTIEVPDKFNPNIQFAAALEEEKKRIQAEFQKRITDINRQISQLTAIEYAP